MPEPSLPGPALDRSVATTVASSTAFLYTGTNPVQTGVGTDTIDPSRASVLRGQVLDRGGEPIPGVTIAVLGHPEYGTTVTQADGMLDMAVNGGGYLTVTYAKAGYLPVQRQVNVPWNGLRLAP